MFRTRAAAAFPPLALTLASLSWAMLLLWDASPYGRYLHHGDWTTTIGLGAALCTAAPGGAWLVPLFFYSGGWLLMSAAMMLPTALPLIRLFDRMIVTRADRTWLHALLISGYLLTWAGFGVVAHFLDQILHWEFGNWTWLAVHPWAPAAAVLAVAGVFQFSTLKYRCLDKCRTPLSFMMSHWHGPRPAWESFKLGVAHGVYCVGCCWALMLLMFVVGTGNIGWMFALGLLMALEKNHPWGRLIAAPLGVSLLTLAALITATGTGMILG